VILGPRQLSLKRGPAASRAPSNSWFQTHGLTFKLLRKPNTGLQRSYELVCDTTVISLQRTLKLTNSSDQNHASYARKENNRQR